MDTNCKIATTLFLLSGVIILCLGYSDSVTEGLQNRDVENSAEACQNPDGCENDEDDTNGGRFHKYEAKRQGKYLYAMETDEQLKKIKIPQHFDDITSSMKKCGQGLSKDTITGEKANSDAPNADEDESMRQNTRTMQDRKRMEARLETWPHDKPRAAVYFIVKAVPYRVNMLKGSNQSPTKFAAQWT